MIKGVSLGSNGYQAASIGIGLIDSKGNTTKVDASKLSYKDGVLTIDKSAFASLDAGIRLALYLMMQTARLTLQV